MEKTNERREHIKRILSAAGDAEVRVEALLARIEQLEARAEKVTAGYGATGGGGAAPDRRYDFAAEVADARTELERRVAALEEKEREIDALIRRVPEERLQTILSLRYQVRWTWTKIAERMGYDERYVKKLGDMALDRAAELGLIPEEAEPEGGNIRGGIRGSAPKKTRKDIV